MYLESKIQDIIQNSLNKSPDFGCLVVTVLYDFRGDSRIAVSVQPNDVKFKVSRASLVFLD